MVGQNCSSSDNLSPPVKVFTISFGFSKYIYHFLRFLKLFFLELYIMLYVTILTSEIKFAAYKIVAIKMYVLVTAWFRVQLITSLTSGN